ncbi:MAG: hypothetical protein WB424_04885 [Terracidiphilus sp.]
MNLEQSPHTIFIVENLSLIIRGMKKPEMLLIAAWIVRVLDQRNDDAALEMIRLEVAELANQFPLYAWRRGL